MEENNLDPQAMPQQPQQREPLPVFDPQNQYGYPQQNTQPYPNMNYPNQPPMYTQAPQTAPVTNPEIQACVESAFNKSLASTIMAWFPICSILAIIFGSIGLKQVKRAEQMAAYYGVSAGGKNIAAKVMGKIGKIAGIVLTAFYGLYFLLFALIFILA